MTTEPSLWSFISNASPIVKFVIFILFMASVASWTIIIQRVLYFKQIQRAANDFKKHFWSSGNLNELFQELAQKSKELFGLAHIFHSGFSEFQRLHKQAGMKPQAMTSGAKRAMHIASAQEMDELERHLSFLATVGSTSPYVGLFGTVWGIMSAFRALGTAGQATIAMVAPGIAEALIATAIGLFAAIPAVIAYNRFTTQLERINYQYEIFQEEVTTIFHREAYRHPTASED